MNSQKPSMVIYTSVSRMVADPANSQLQWWLNSWEHLNNYEVAWKCAPCPFWDIYCVRICFIPRHMVVWCGAKCDMLCYLHEPTSCDFQAFVFMAHKILSQCLSQSCLIRPRVSLLYISNLKGIGPLVPEIRNPEFLFLLCCTALSVFSHFDLCQICSINSSI